MSKHVSRIFFLQPSYTGNNTTAGEVPGLKTVIYLDVLLLVNFFIAWFLLMAAALLTGIRARFRRLVPAGMLAAACALILLAPEMPYPLQIGYKLITSAAIVLLAFGWRGWQRFLTAVCWYASLNLLLAGLAILVILQTANPLIQTGNLTVYLRISPLLLLVLSGGCWGAAELLLRFARGPQKQAETIGVQICLCDCAVRLRAALDTGCHLKDPLTCLPVLLISYPDAKARLPQGICDFLESWFTGETQSLPPPGANLRLIPCTTAEGRSILPGFAVSDIDLISNSGAAPVGRTAVAFARQSFGNEAYEALYGSDFL